ncbi:hypothetical protein SAMN05421505_104100 [Sinosporangium album]|uniref:Uncharacterized protein n=1 Tax=Sinosporangium album TaxID=504805 RepID=A0A1G7U4D6_9ACTN|nr:hypothetical protein [Sinosporangium album]SDG42492.1 hypothetical protein SAMN05421505_104100 [Sinosporangium album]
MYNGLVDGGFGWPRGQNLVPTGVYAGGSALWRRLAERDNIIAHWPEGRRYTALTATVRISARPSQNT